MPPKEKKVKEKPVKGAEAEQMVLEYMRMTNRPYSSNDVSTNLKDKVSKPEAAKVLAALAEKDEITAKAYGKQTIYVYNQAKLDVLSSEEMAALDAQAKEVKDVLDEKKKELRQLQNELSSKLSTPKTPDLTKAIQEIKAANAKLLQALAAYRGESAAPPMSTEEMAKIDKDWTIWRKAWTERKKTYKEAVGMLQEAGVVGKQDAWEEDQGIEGEDDEAIAVENGEFVKPAVLKKPMGTKTGGKTTLGKHARSATASTSASKRSRSST